jgi:hypothetical protein
MPQFGASLTDDSRIVIYDRNMFIVQTTGHTGRDDWTHIDQTYQVTDAPAGSEPLPDITVVSGDEPSEKIVDFRKRRNRHRRCRRQRGWRRRR